MKVKIVKCSNPIHIHNNLIGLELKSNGEYTINDINDHWVVEESGLEFIVPKSDCEIIEDEVKQSTTPAHYKEELSIYKIAEIYELNSYEFDIIKRVMRCRKKGQFIEDIDKTIHLLELYKKEYEKKQ